MYENQKVFIVNPLIKQIKRVWIKSVSPIAKGCFINKIKDLFKKFNVIKNK